MAVNEIARVYAGTLFEFGKQKNMLAEFKEEIIFVAGLLGKENDLKIFFASPEFTKKTKKDFIKKIFSNRLSEQVVNFLYLLVDNDRQSSLPDICEEFTVLTDAEQNKMRATVITSVPLESATRDIIIQELKSKYKKDIILKEEVDQNIIGGIIIKIGDLVIDGSLSKDLKIISNNLIISKLRSESAYEN